MYTTKKQKKRCTDVSTSSGASIYDYAHAKGVGGRMRKQFEKASQVHLSENEENEPKAIKKTIKRKQTRTNVLFEKNYPIEIWRLISFYIRPEDVGRFAGICKTTYKVVNRAEFWLNMYQRFCKGAVNVPEVVQPHPMGRTYGLRTRVIRTLHHVYPPFVRSPETQEPLQPRICKQKRTACKQTRKQRELEILNSLIGRVCTEASLEKCTSTNQWKFSAKLRKRNLVSCSRLVASDSTKEFGDLNANEDEGCKILQIWKMDYSPLPMLTGLALKGVSRKGIEDTIVITLEFSDGPTAYSSNDVVLKDVQEVSTLNWWHPLFPHSKSDHP